MIIPDCYSMMCGIGIAHTSLNSFDRALFNAGIGDLNLTTLSSILPPGAEYCEQYNIPAGAVTYIAMAVKTSDDQGELISAAIAAAIPADLEEPGVLMEGCFNFSRSQAKDRVIDMAETAMLDRKIEIKEIKSISTECVVVDYSTVVAAVILWQSYQIESA